MPSIAQRIFDMHLYCPAMLAMFPLQDVFALKTRYATRPPEEERINNPSTYRHYWKYRMHVRLEDLLGDDEFTHGLHTMMVACGRAYAT